MKYLPSGCKLCDKTLASLAAYFESGFDARVADGTLRKLRDKQVCVKARNEYRHELQARYHNKLKHLANNRRCEHSWRRDRDGSNHGGKSRERATHASASQTPGTMATARRHTNRPPRSPATCMGPRQSICMTSAVPTQKISAVQTTTTTTSPRTTPTTTTSANTRAGMTLVRTLPNLPSPAMGR